MHFLLKGMTKTHSPSASLAATLLTSQKQKTNNIPTSTAPTGGQVDAAFNTTTDPHG